jgi:hypothetical protein
MVTIQCFWHGRSFTLLEKLTLKSFINNGYNVNLWCYTEKVSLDCPPEVNICDANNVLDFNELFTYTGTGDCRRGSLGGFSDLFRYVVLYKFGGVYVDMDSTCLKPFNFAAEYVIKPHKMCGTVANVLKAPQGCRFLETCIENTRQQINSDNGSWVKPVQIFDSAVREHKLEEYIVPVHYFGHDNADDLAIIKRGNYTKNQHILPEYIVHWCHEASYGLWNIREICDWDKPLPLSIYHRLLLKNKLI